MHSTLCLESGRPVSRFIILYFVYSPPPLPLPFVPYYLFSFFFSFLFVPFPPFLQVIFFSCFVFLYDVSVKILFFPSLSQFLKFISLFVLKCI